ncbi:MAG: hypothetical protein ABSE46_24795 [Terracidiphilus sp.]|jgi:hypothetical protein
MDDLDPNSETVDAMRAARAGETSEVTLGELQAEMDLDDFDSPEVVALRAAIRAALLAGESFSSIKDILATEDGILDEERAAAGVPAPPSFREQMADPTALERHHALMRKLIHLNSGGPYTRDEMNER